MKKNVFLYSFVRVPIIILTVFFSFIFSSVSTEAINPFECAASVDLWIRNADTSTIRDLIQESYPVNNPNTNGTGTAVVFRGRTTNSLDTRRQHLVRWDTRAPNEILRDGFIPRRSCEEDEFLSSTNLWQYANNNDPSIFVGTTIVRSNNRMWVPRARSRGTMYGYDIFAPGGIDVNESLGTSYQYRNQYEIAFPGGIQRRYIRSVVEYRNGNVVRIFTNPYFDPGIPNIPPRKASKDKFVWRENHPQGGDPGTSSRETYEDPMFGGNGGEEGTIEIPENDNDPIGNGFHRILSADKRYAIAADGTRRTEASLKKETQWEFVYNEKYDYYEIRNKVSRKTLRDLESVRVVELPDGNYYFTDQYREYIFKFNEAGSLILTKFDFNESNMPSYCKFKIEQVQTEPFPLGVYHIESARIGGYYLNAKNPELTTNIGMLTYGVKDSQLWLLIYDPSKEAYKISPFLDDKSALTWTNKDGKHGPTITNCVYDDNNDQLWYIDAGEFEKNDEFRIVNYADGITNIDVNGNLSVNAEKTPSYWKIKRFELDPLIGEEGAGLFISPKHNFDKKITLPTVENIKYPVLTTDPYQGTTNQKWVARYDSDSNNFDFTLPRRTFDTLSWDSKKGIDVIGYPWNDFNDQKWRLVREPSGYYRFHNQENYDKVLTSYDNHVVVSDFLKKNLIDHDLTGDDNQLWQITNTFSQVVSNGTYTFASKSDHKKVITDTKDGLVRQSYIGQIGSEFYCTFHIELSKQLSYYKVETNLTGGHGFAWQIEYQMDKGAVTIRNQITNKLLTAVGDKITEETPNQSDSQLWYVIPK